MTGDNRNSDNHRNEWNIAEHNSANTLSVPLSRRTAIKAAGVNLTTSAGTSLVPSTVAADDRPVAVDPAGEPELHEDVHPPR